MTASGEYTVEQIEMVKQQATIITDRTIKKKATVNTPTRQDLSPCNPLIGWKTGNTTLPKDWKIKRHEYANQTVYFYMSPKGDIIKSRRAVLEYMFDEGDGEYSEKDFLTVISGAKQRKVALQELYDAKLNRKSVSIKRKRRRKSVAKDDSEDEQDENEYVSDGDDDLDNAEQEDEDEDDKFSKSAKKQRLDKEPIQPTRRSGRIKEKKKEVGSDNEGSDSDSEMSSPPAKRRCLDEDNQVVPVVSTSTPTNGTVEVKRKRGRPPKNPPATLQSFPQTNSQTGDGAGAQEKLGGAFVKLDLLKVDLNNDNEIKDFTPLSSSTDGKLSDIKAEIKEESVKQEAEHKENQNSIHSNQNANVDSKVTVEDLFVTREEYDDVSTNLVKDEMCNSNADIDGSINENLVDSPHTLSAYHVVVNVLDDLVSTISE